MLKFASTIHICRGGKNCNIMQDLIYIKKPKGKKFVWGGQTTFHTDKDFASKLIKKAKDEGIL